MGVFVQQTQTPTFPHQISTEHHPLPYTSLHPVKRSLSHIPQTHAKSSKSLIQTLDIHASDHTHVHIIQQSSHKTSVKKLKVQFLWSERVNVSSGGQNANYNQTAEKRACQQAQDSYEDKSVASKLV